jgi:hypothetical protein
MGMEGQFNVKEFWDFFPDSIKDPDGKEYFI